VSDGKLDSVISAGGGQPPLCFLAAGLRCPPNPQDYCPAEVCAGCPPADMRTRLLTAARCLHGSTMGPVMSRHAALFGLDMPPSDASLKTQGCGA